MNRPFIRPASHAALPPHDRAEIAEALFSFAAGFDLHDRALLESVLASDATMDFTSIARRLGVNLPVFEGRRAIADAIVASTDGLDTTPAVSNVRVIDHDGKRAVVGALVEEHFVCRADGGRHLVLMNGYTVALRTELGRWIISSLEAESIWISGDPEVLWLPSVIATRAAAPILLGAWKGRKLPSAR